MKRSWYRIENKAEAPKVADVYILDMIATSDYWGDGLVTAKQFIKDLQALPEGIESIRVHINSPGGDVFAGLAIANALREQGTKGRAVETIADGLAASAASIVLMAGSKVTVSDNALVMVHNPYTWAVGNAADMRKLADTLDTVRDSLVATYRWHTTKSEAEVIALMDAETWMDADEAIANGFATDKVEGLKAAASIDPRAAAKLQVPERFQARVADFLRAAEDEEPATGDPEPSADPAPEPAPEPAPAPEPTPEPVPEPAAAAADADAVLALCEEAGLPLAFARELRAARLPLAQAQERISTEKAKRAAEARRETEIRALCDRFKVGDLAASLIAGGMPLEEAKKLVAQVRVLKDAAEIDGGLKPEAGPKAPINYSEIYAQLNKPAH